MAIPEGGDCLLGELGQRLWSKVRGEDDGDEFPGFDAGEAWRAPQVGPIDFRFTNLAALDDPEDQIARRGILPASRAQWRVQALRQRCFPADQPKGPAAAQRFAALEGDLFDWALAQLDPLARSAGDEPVDMFFLK